MSKKKPSRQQTPMIGPPFFLPLLRPYSPDPSSQIQWVPILNITVNQGSAPDEAVSDILSDLSVLYRMTGGSGINFENTPVILHLNHE